jgi:hypothetical protein
MLVYERSPTVARYALSSKNESSFVLKLGKTTAMADSNTQGLGLFAKLVVAVAASLIVAGVLWHGVTLENFQRMWTNLTDRPSGPMAFRFILQPSMATIAAIRDGLHDGRTERSPYLWTILRQGSSGLHYCVKVWTRPPGLSFSGLRWMSSIRSLCSGYSIQSKRLSSRCCLHLCLICLFAGWSCAYTTLARRRVGSNKRVDMFQKRGTWYGRSTLPLEYSQVRSQSNGRYSFRLASHPPKR